MSLLVVLSCGRFNFFFLNCSQANITVRVDNPLAVDSLLTLFTSARTAVGREMLSLLFALASW